MICYFTSLLSLLFLFSMIYMVVMVDTQSLTKNLLSKLTPEQQTLYKSIVNERKKLYFQGFLLGFLLSMLSLYLMKTSTKLSISLIVSLTICISYVVMYFYYNLMPKQDLLVVHLDNQDAREAWIKYYNTMKINYHLSILLGLIFIGLFSLSLCKN